MATSEHDLARTSPVAGRGLRPGYGRTSSLFAFPDPVNEVAARWVAGGVALLSLLTITLGQPVLLGVLAYGFVARVLTGPRLSPLALLVTRVIVPRLPVPARPVPGPPKRFAQGIGATLSLTAVVLYFGFGLHTAAFAVVGLITVAALLESVFAYCLGCKMFALLMRAGIIPADVCVRCADVGGGTRPS
jgi:hypothetical protein